MAHAGGRPTKYCQKLAEEIASKIATTRYGVDRLSKMNPHWPAETNIFLWIARYPEFRQLYEDAKRMQIEVIVDQMLDIADDTTNDNIIKINKDGSESEVCNTEYINRSRVRIDTRKWLAAKLMPKKYGESKKDEDENPLQNFLEQLKSLAKDSKNG